MGGESIFFLLVCQWKHSDVLTNSECPCRQEQLIRGEHSVSGHMCSGKPVSQHATGKHHRERDGMEGGVGSGRRLTSSRANMKSPWWHVMVSAPQAPGTLPYSPVCTGREGVENCRLSRPHRNLSSLQDWSHSEMFLCLLVFKLLLSALIGLSLMSKQTTTAAK